MELFDPKYEHHLHVIKVNNAGNVTECCAQMLKLWLEKHPTATWDRLLKALEAPGVELKSLASKIQRKLLSSEGMFTVYKLYVHNKEPYAIMINWKLFIFYLCNVLSF